MIEGILTVGVILFFLGVLGYMDERDRIQHQALWKRLKGEDEKEK